MIVLILLLLNDLQICINYKIIHLKNEKMKKAILFLAAISFITMSAITTPIIKNDKYKACIEACNTCISSCKKVEKICEDDKTSKMANCEKLCKECITTCNEAVKMMNENSKSVKSKCLECAEICEKCATECDKFNMKECKKCATDCRNAAKLCREM